MQRVWIGTSGWVYKHWAKSFYPPDWPKKDEFLYYSKQFPTVEINSTFYRLPSESTVNGWCRKAPESFIFAVKGSRFITHIKRLKEVNEAVDTFFARISLLKEHVGPILWQLPPNFHKDTVRLEEFLRLLPRHYQHALEFRHPSWMIEEVFSLLEKYEVANVWLSSSRMPMDFTRTARFVYVRFHGLENGAAHDYTAAELKPWAEQLNNAAQEGHPAFVYFNNDLNTRAPLNAKLLGAMIGDAAAETSSDSSEDYPAMRRVESGLDLSQEPRSKRLSRG